MGRAMQAKPRRSRAPRWRAGTASSIAWQAEQASLQSSLLTLPTAQAYAYSVSWTLPPRSIVPALDTPSLDVLRTIVDATSAEPLVGAYKVGFSLALRYGLPRVIGEVRRLTTKPVIYDHQKAGTDIPDTGAAFAAVLKDAGCEAAILFALAGPNTLTAWVEACQSCGLHVIVGAEMTHPRFLEEEGGSMSRKNAEAAYKLAQSLGVSSFVVPGNRPERIRFYRELLGPDVVFFSPGLVTQGGELSAAAEAAGGSWHAIVGRALLDSSDPKAATRSLVAGLQAG